MKNLQLYTSLLATVIPFTVAVSAFAEKPLVDHVRPMIGAITLSGYGGHGLGKTFPGAATPLGMIQLSPDTVTGGDNGCGYSYHHETIQGFSFTHMSGVGWYGDLGNFQVMPSVGPERILDRDKVASPYSHDREEARAGYYRVELPRYQVTAELTAAPRAGIIRFTFPEAETARIQIDLGRRVGQNGRWLSHSSQTVRVIDDHTIEGRMVCSDKDGGWGHGAGKVNYTQYFYAVFSKPFARFGVWDKERVMEGTSDYTGTNTGFFAEFPTRAGERVLLRAGFSYVDGDGAKHNLEKDIPAFDFDGVRTKARALWDHAFQGVLCEGGSEKERTIFATALYHCLIDPRAIGDSDGRYVGADGKIHQSDRFVSRTVFSGWDVFRSQFPLLTLIRPDIVNDTICSMMQVMALGNRNALPIWDLFACTSGCMIGNPAVPVIADAYEKGIRGFDAELALRQCMKSVDARGNRPHGFTPGSLSCTLEYAYDDWCVSRLAELLGHPEEARIYAARAMCYTNCWDPSVKWMRTRLAPDQPGQVRWLEWKGRKVHNQGTVESNPYQQGWFVPHDVYGLIRLMGGERTFAEELTAFFDQTPENVLWNDFYNHPNEPCHHIAYLFPYAGRPWLTQKWTRRICEAAYGDDVRGICGNEDVGQMSAWYVLSAMGLHPVCPGSGLWMLTAPVFPKITVRLDPAYYPGKAFTVIAEGVSPANRYIQSAALNGKPINRAWLTTREVSAGGTLSFVLGPEPNTAWGTEKPPR